MERQWFGLNPAISHAINIVFLYVSTLFLYHLLRRLLSRQPNAEVLAALGALVFLCHPRNVEAAAWISGRFDVFATFFLLAGLYVFICIQNKYFKNLIVVLCHLAALASKEIGILMPVVLFCVWMLDKHQSKQPWKPVICEFFQKNVTLLCLLVVNSIVYLYLRSRHASGMMHMGVTWEFIYQSYLVYQLPTIALKEYLFRTVLPFYNMGVILPIEYFITVSNQIISAVVSLVVIGGIIYGAVKRYTIIFAVIAYLAMISLVLYLIPIGITGITQDRFLMSALPFYSLLIAYVAQQCIIHFNHIRAWFIGLCTYIFVIALITFQIIPTWSNSLMFWLTMSNYQEKYTNEFHPMLLFAYAHSNLPEEMVQQRIDELIARERAETKKTGTFRPIVYIMYAQYLILKKNPEGLDIMEEYMDVLHEMRSAVSHGQLIQNEAIPDAQIEDLYTSYAHGALIMRNDIEKADAALQEAKKLRTGPVTFNVLVYDVIFDILKNRQPAAQTEYQTIRAMTKTDETQRKSAVVTINRLVNQVCEAKKLSVPACQNLPFNVEKFFAGQ
ncbi:hypothetical protein HMPREF9098_1851 [Kingella denitrificans ATCC 33394]|uniref:Tetratricopeptide repeat protein n=2 Tax=Kingella denitrificans TaxID=502 RepID=F0F166_9NEIS|nr:hypothetical protein HMPREF9098_1851 [Kingella denitrificans ATCC 33394]